MGGGGPSLGLCLLSWEDTPLAQPSVVSIAQSGRREMLLSAVVSQSDGALSEQGWLPSTTWQSPCLSCSLPGPQCLAPDPHSHPHLTDGKMRPGGSHSPFPQRPSPESSAFPSQGCDPRLMGWGVQRLLGREVGFGGLKDPPGVCLQSCLV